MNKKQNDTTDLLGVPLFPSAVYSYEQAAQHAGVSLSTIRRAIENRLLRGGKNRVTGRAVLIWIERNGANTGRTSIEVEAERVKASQQVVRATRQSS